MSSISLSSVGGGGRGGESGDGDAGGCGEIYSSSSPTAEKPQISNRSLMTQSTRQNSNFVRIIFRINFTITL